MTGCAAIYTIRADGGARVEEVHASELDALRANRNNTDATHKSGFCRMASPSVSWTIRTKRRTGLAHHRCDRNNGTHSGYSATMSTMCLARPLVSSLPCCYPPAGC